MNLKSLTLNMILLTSGVTIRPSLKPYQERSYQTYQTKEIKDLEEKVNFKTENKPKNEIKGNSKRDKDNKISPEYYALLDTISWAESTYYTCDKNISSYQVLIGGIVKNDFNQRYGGKLKKECFGNYFIGYDNHPNIQIEWAKNKKLSTAAGRYQFMYFTYKGLQHYGQFKNFSPEEQDRAALFIIQEKKISPEILEKTIKKQNFILLWHNLANIWASLPTKLGGSYYKQGVRKRKDLKEKFNKFYQQRLTNVSS